MKRILTATLALIMFSSGLVSGLTPSQAQAAPDSDVVRDLALKCWQKPADMTIDRASATFQVVYDAAGQLADLTTIEYLPARKAGQEYARTMQQAILDCAREAPVKSRTLRVIFNYRASLGDQPNIREKLAM